MFDEQQKVRVGYTREMARKVSKKYNLVPPVDVVYVAQGEGFDVEYELMAVCAQFNRQEKVIVVNKNDHLHRQRLSIAHELGHIFLHHDIDFHNYNGQSNDFEKFRNVQENEAFEFARELLVPLKHINLFNKEGLTIPEMASRCCVSNEVIFISLQKLNKF
ncbi:MAG: ImmA/IrrE family metallo-endopeptidase [Clostridiales bacterium]|jgi:Zn-dependent peptidase ImmA (M78 family)|nr:ImmA/IrrE family metallo-endopeptidase [Clostridiales bacterium]